MIEWENNIIASYYVGTIAGAKFEVSEGVGGKFGVMMSHKGDCNPILSTAETVEEAKRFCEWVARAYGLDK